MENVRSNYSKLLGSYELASDNYVNSGSTELLKHALEELETFERDFIRSYSVEHLQELQYSITALN